MAGVPHPAATSAKCKRLLHSTLKTHDAAYAVFLYRETGPRTLLQVVGESRPFLVQSTNPTSNPRGKREQVRAREKDGERQRERMDEGEEFVRRLFILLVQRHLGARSDRPPVLIAVITGRAVPRTCTNHGRLWQDRRPDSRRLRARHTQPNKNT